jgi:hypothetical protein
VLRERDKPGGLAVGLIDQVVRYALDGGYHVVLEGILRRSTYGRMIEDLIAAHLGSTFVFYLDVSLPEMLRRHATRPQATDFTADDVCGWYLDKDLLGVDGEHRIDETSSAPDTVSYIARTAGLTLDERDEDPPAGTTRTRGRGASCRR